MSEATFQQDKAHKALKRYQLHFQELWAKDEWYGKSPNNLPPIENLWTTAQEEMYEMTLAIPDGTLAMNARTPRFGISSETPDRLLSGVSDLTLISIREE